LLLRRLAGAFEVPLSPLSLLFVGAISAALAAAARLTWPVLRTSSRTMNLREWRRNTPHAIPTAALVVLGIALSLPETSITGLLALWAFLLLEELWAWAPSQTFFLRGDSVRPRRWNIGKTTEQKTGLVQDQKTIRETASEAIARGGMERGLCIGFSAARRPNRAGSDNDLMRVHQSSPPTRTWHTGRVIFGFASMA
jgi:hypothetical protein